MINTTSQARSARSNKAPRLRFPIDVLARSWALEQAVVAVGVLAAVFWFVIFSRTLLPGVLVPVAAILGVPLLFIRSWEVWDVYEWHLRARMARRTPEPEPEILALEGIAIVLALRQTAQARALLDQIKPSSPSAIAAVAYARAAADLLEKRLPDLQPFRDSMRLFEKDDVRYPGLLVQLASLEAGAADLRHENWRRPLVECRRELGIRFSLWRALWPIRRILITAVLTLGLVIVLYNQIYLAPGA